MLFYLALELEQARRWEQAERVVGSIEEENWKGWALGKLARILVLAQHWEEVERVALSIEEKYWGERWR